MVYVPAPNRAHHVVHVRLDLNVFNVQKVLNVKNYHPASSLQHQPSSNAPRTPIVWEERNVGHALTVCVPALEAAHHAGLARLGSNVFNVRKALSAKNYHPALSLLY
jgi:hypothetical protein